MGIHVVLLLLLAAVLSQPPRVVPPLPPAGQDQGCVRGAAEPILKKSVYPKARFKLQKDKLSGVETVSFANGDRLIINNWGCEYYVLTFRFETSRFRQDTTARAQWYRHGIILMTELLPGLQAPLNIKGGVAALRRATERGKVGPDYTEISYGGQGIREFVTVNRIQQLPGGRYALELTFASGPL